MNPRYTEITINDLPKYSGWPARILGFEKFEPRIKNQEELMREYEAEKWGPMWQRYQDSASPSNFIEIIQQLCEPLGDSVVWIDGQLQKMGAFESYEAIIDVVERALKPYLGDGPVVELGAGYGRIILSLVQRGLIKDCRVWAGEYAPSGVKMIAALARASGWSVRAGHCDFSAKPMIDFTLPSDGLIFTAFATPCVPMLPDSFVEELCAMRPRTVVHIEPIYEQCDTRTLLGMMQRRYLEMNDYNRNLLSLLQKHERAGRVRILDVSEPVFGSNPFMVASVISWCPVSP